MADKFNYKIIIEYLGAGFCGWQRQKEKISIQQLIEEAIYKTTKENVFVRAAGRTDAGVHAYGQVGNFELISERDPYLLMESINFFCRPHKVGVVACELIDSNFDARFSAKKRYYVYKILNRKSQNIIDYGFKYLVKDHLDIDLMKEGASYLVGNHDFTSFRASECQSSSPIKTIENIEIVRHSENVEIYVTAISFLHHMVRNIVGNLVQVGRGEWPPNKLKEILDAKDRTQGASTAPAEGLYFLKVDY